MCVCACFQLSSSLHLIRYYNGFQKLRQFPPVADNATNVEFTQLLKRLVDEHGPLVESLAAGLRECKSKPVIGDQLKVRYLLSLSERDQKKRHID